MNRTPERSCEGKRPYPDEPAAAAAARRRRSAGIIVTPYRCHHCGAWHIGHPSIRTQLRQITRGKPIKPRRRK